jgi:hypothetical protein
MGEQLADARVERRGVNQRALAQSKSDVMTRQLRVAQWLGRGVLLAVTVILGLISEKFLLDTTAQAASRGILFSKAIGTTVARVGLGGFPLACAFVTALCLVSVERIRSGLWFVIVLFGTVLCVRLVGAAADGSMSASIPLIIPEIVFLVVTSSAIALGSRARTVK